MADKLKTLKPVRPNVGIEMLYRKLLWDMIREMAEEVAVKVERAYKRHEPAMAQDATPAVELRDAIAKMTAKWESRFDRSSEELAAHFAQAAGKRSDAALKAILRKGGFSVKFKQSRAMRDVMQATIGEQVGLIKSIPQQYLGAVEGMVMRSAATGRDLATLSRNLQKHYGVTRRRAAFIARDQNNKATATMTRVRQTELGITEAVWIHSGGGKHPRPTHLKAGRDKVKYDVTKGWYDPHEKKYIFPGELINCRCVSGAVVPGFS